MILVTGAAGKTGQAVIRALAGLGQAVRALDHHPERRQTLQANGAKEVVTADMRDEGALQRAAQDVRAIYHIPPNVSPHEVEIGRKAIRAAQAAGVEHFVYHSVLHPQAEAMPHHWHKLRVEEMLFESGLPVTILQPSAYMQNVLASWEAISRLGIFRVPYPVETRLSLVDLEDIAEAACLVLTETGHAGATYELAGPEPLAQTEVAEILSRQLGHSVRAEAASLEQWEQGPAASFGSYQLAALAAMFRYYAAHGLQGNPNVLGWLLGRSPTSFEAFVERIVRSRGDR